MPEPAAAGTEPLPEGWTLRPAPGLRVSNAWTLLYGGSPTTLVRLSAAGAGTVKRLFAGTPIGPSPAERSLARRLELNGMAVASPPAPRQPAATTVIIPYYNDPDGLRRTCSTLGAAAGTLPIDVVVVDDASTEPLELHQLHQLQERKTTVIRHDTNRGPAAARNTGASEAATETLVFLDAGAEIDPEILARLLSYLDDPHTVAVAPRVSATAGASRLVSTYERSRSPLDLGSTPALVRPLSAVSYVPSTCIAIKADAFGRVGGFDSDLRFGEDVDLVWRLGAEGVVRYIADLEARHPARDTMSSFVRQRFSYGTSAASLASRHREATTPLVLDRWGAASALSIAAGSITLPLAISSYRSRSLASALPQDLAGRGVVAATTIAKSQMSMLNGLLAAAARPYGPLIALGLLATRTNPATAVTASLAARMLSLRSIGLVAVSVVDDAAYSAGVWRGAIKQRSWRCLRPKLLHGPPARWATGR